MKNSDKKVNIRAFRDVKKQYLGGGGGELLTCVNNKPEVNHPTIYSIKR